MKLWNAVARRSMTIETNPMNPKAAAELRKIIGCCARLWIFLRVPIRLPLMDSEREILPARAGGINQEPTDLGVRNLLMRRLRPSAGNTAARNRYARIVCRSPDPALSSGPC